MHSIRPLLATATLLLSLAPGASVRAAPVSFSGSLSFRVASLPAISVPASGTLTLNGSAGGAALASLAVSASEFDTTQQRLTASDPGVFPMAGVQLTARNDAATFDGSPLGGPMRLNGAMKVCLYAACGDDENIANLSVPLTVVGYGGIHWVQGGVFMTVVGAPWTTATAAAGTATAMGFVAGAGGHGASTAASQGGHVRLVTPAFIQSHIGALSFVPIIGTLDLHFVPEPGTLAMLGIGITALAGVGARRRSSLSKRAGRIRSLSLVVTWLVVATLPGAAHSGPVPFHGTLTLELVGIGSVSLPGAGVLSIAPGSGSLASLTLPASAFDGSATTPISDFELFPARGVQATLRNDPGAFSGVPLAGAMPLPGGAKICLYAFCGITGSFSSNIANLSIPLDVVGLGGAATHFGDINVTVVGAPWTSATAIVGTLTRMGFVQSAGSGTGSTAAQGGRMQLVTPVFISTNFGAFAGIQAFGILDLHFVPEPGTLAMLGGGIATLSAAGMRRTRIPSQR